MHNINLQRCTTLIFNDTQYFVAKILQESGNVTANLKTGKSCYKYVRLCYHSAIAATSSLLQLRHRCTIAAAVILQPLLCCCYRLTIAAILQPLLCCCCRLTIAAALQAPSDIALKTVQFYGKLHRSQCNFMNFCTKISATLRWRRRS